MTLIFQARQLRRPETQKVRTPGIAAAEFKAVFSLNLRIVEDQFAPLVERKVDTKWLERVVSEFSRFCWITSENWRSSPRNRAP